MSGCWGAHYCQWNNITTAAAAAFTPFLSIDYYSVFTAWRRELSSCLDLYIVNVYV